MYKRKRFIAKIMASTIIMFVAFATMQWAVDYAYRWRGYEAVGGEWLIPIYALGGICILWKKAK